MPARQNTHHADLKPLIEVAVQRGDVLPLERYVTKANRVEMVEQVKPI